MVIFKKGEARKMNNYRGLLVSDHVSKVITMLLYKHVRDAYHKQIGDAQYGSAKHRGTTLASLMLRTFADAATAQGYSWFVLSWISARHSTSLSEKL